MAPNEPSAAELEELKHIVEEATKIGESTIDYLTQRLQSCIRVGEKLIEFKKRMPHGQWLPWLETNADKLSTTPTTSRTFQRWMTLAKKVADGTLDVTNAKSLRQAYQLADMLPDVEDSKSKNGAAEPLYLTHALRLAAALKQIDVTRLSDDLRESLKSRLQPIVDTYNSL